MIGSLKTDFPHFQAAFNAFPLSTNHICLIAAR